MAQWIYDRRPDESTKAFEAFSLYRSLGVSRTHESVAEKLSKSVTLIHRWASVYGWKERVIAYDDHIEAQARRKIEADSIKRKADMLSRHAQEGRTLQHKGLEYLMAHGINKSSDAIAAIRIGTEMERLASGLPLHLLEIAQADNRELMLQYRDLLISLSGNIDEPPDADTDEDDESDSGSIIFIDNLS